MNALKQGDRIKVTDKRSIYLGYFGTAEKVDEHTVHIRMDNGGEMKKSIESAADPKQLRILA
ncbi:hypothetical protein [Paeniglutamicibacter terrestris]|uniref:KOW domain-containing protein n=1 Tax=Paeniglutamicibacter terrestris TaxID=2723403 RepID=A0ABX1G862_9MICC|nr:hypothetical protein [Paeniglutamicibacter terrestris]NKG22234.1 hypothetical protein [Paeniglutamicibacter terrestris]